MSLDINRLRPSASIEDTLHSLFSHNWRGMFIGKAGAGKTYVFKKAGPDYHVELLGPSNLSAMVLGGRTLCSWLGISDTTPASLASIDTDRVIRGLVTMAMHPKGKHKGVYIDEMSLFNASLFEFIDKVFERGNNYLISKGLPPIHLIWGGDFLQLRTIDGSPIYHSPLVGKYRITITPDVHRQKDVRWKACLDAIREGNHEEVREYFRDPCVAQRQLSTALLKPSVMGPYGVHIVGRREDVYTYANMACLEMSHENNTPWFTYLNGYEEGKREKGRYSHKPVHKVKQERYLHVTQGMRVKASSPEGGVVKGQFGTVKGCSQDRVDVLFDGGPECSYYPKPNEVLNLEPGNVATVHSIQGLTIPEGSYALVDLMSPFTAKTEGGLYVCASRTVNPDNTVFVCRYWSEMLSRFITDTSVLAKGLY